MGSFDSQPSAAQQFLSKRETRLLAQTAQVSHSQSSSGMQGSRPGRKSEQSEGSEGQMPAQVIEEQLEIQSLRQRLADVEYRLGLWGGAVSITGDPLSYISVRGHDGG
ncbi:hypothetical protein AMATHDRAFT_65921 [Amanita thiersii Skay4041]|uniref:Uncharacterized protein n=1 Tax=Amanita thiersii Skay4041 TaxID=703135 RepID=A0A2A9NKQ4_9AGAR|nr:hypothetical protein AMATHDRAFT_65921 [Amanita thiersii Skay4041]